MTLLDTHHHFDFLDGWELRARFLKRLADEDVRIVAQTLLPSLFLELRDGAARRDGLVVPPLWSVGFHPWEIRDDGQVEAELAAFDEAMRATRFVGEIGLDFSPRRLEAAPAELQRGVLREVLERACRAGEGASGAEPVVLSIHAVRAVGDVLALLEEVEAPRRNVVPIFHRFAGGVHDVPRLLALGGCLSVHPQLLAGRRGRHVLERMPSDRLLLESDLPRQGVPAGSDADAASDAASAASELAGSLRETIAALSIRRGDTASAGIALCQSRLYGVE